MWIWTLVFAVATIGAADTSLAQPRAPIGWAVADVRGASVGLPAVQGWIPDVTADTNVPARSLGIEAGAHLHVVRVRGFALGLGATFLTGRGTSSPPADGGAFSGPEVTTRLRSIVPQLSLNFGHALGWSYVSAGLGRTRIESTAAAPPPLVLAPRDSGWTKTLNFGGGARWFITDHVGVGFDLRWYRLSLIPPSATHTGAPRASLFTAGAGLTLK